MFLAFSSLLGKLKLILPKFECIDNFLNTSKLSRIDDQNIFMRTQKQCRNKVFSFVEMSIGKKICQKLLFFDLLFYNFM